MTGQEARDNERETQIQADIREGLVQSAAGEVHDLGSFAEYVEDGNPDPEIIDAVQAFHQPGIVPLDPKPWYVIEADEGQGPDAGRYSMAAYLEDSSKGEHGGTMSNIAIWKPREEYEQTRSAYSKGAQ